MIAKISSGKDTAGLIRYLYGPGRANEHIDPHLVASFDGFAPDPGRSHDPSATKKLLTADLDLRVKQAERLDRAPNKHVWHCSVRTAPEDRTLTDDEWATVARRILAATGIAPDGDQDGCRWAAVRHAEDHIHIVATKMRGDLRPPRHWNDYLTADRELAVIEKEYGLRHISRGDRTAAKRPTRAEQEKTRRAGRSATPRETLRATVRTAVAAAIIPEEFLTILGDIDGVLLQTLYFPSGDIRGYKIALEDDTNATGQPIWYSGSKLAPDLSYPQINKRLDPARDRTDRPQSRPSGNPWHQVTAAVDDIAHHLDHDSDRAAQADIAAFGETLDALPLVAPKHFQQQLRQAARAFERATRSRICAEHHHGNALRNAARQLLREPAPDNGTSLAMLLDVAILVAAAAANWHQVRHHDQQVTAAQQALQHLQAAYQEAAREPVAALARHPATANAVSRYVEQVRALLPEHAGRVLRDPSWPALATVLSDAEAAGCSTSNLLQRAAHQRPLIDARRPAEALMWRIERQAARRPTRDPRDFAPRQAPADRLVPHSRGESAAQPRRR